MGLLFGPSRRDQIHLISALQSLNSTSVAGLAAALSWSERKTERVVRDVLTLHGSPVTFDVRRRVVAIRRSSAAPQTVPASISGGVAAPTAPTPPAALEPLPIALPRSFGGAGRCPSCHAALIATATGDASVCPKCGHLSNRPVAAPDSTSAPEAPAAAAELPPRDVATLVHGGDRRSQELFAAWVTSRPIPCPRCRSTLQHRGVGEYGCPSCGHRVAFETTLGGFGKTPPAAPVAPEARA
jgi:uncharacterized Zn finger protein (UPF0148 family)